MQMLTIGQILETVYNMVMKKVLKLVLVMFVVLFLAQVSRAEEYRILVLPDNIQFDSTNYLVYPDSSVMFATDTINEIKRDGRVHTVSMTEVRDTLRKNQKLATLTKNALKEYKYNYNIPFVDFKSIADKFSTNKVLVITSQTDTQNYAIRRSIWDILNFPGESVVDPAYKMSTYAALIDVDKEEVLWQQTYYKTIKAKDNRILAVSFAPATEQLERIKDYSLNALSPEIARMVQVKILPPPLPLPNGNNIIEISDVKQAEAPVEPVEVPQLKPKAMPLRPNTKNTGMIINDI